MLKTLIAACMLLVATGAEAARKAEYAYGPHKDQALDVYIPDTAPRNAPIVVMLHGGAWAIGDKAHRRVLGEKVGHYTGQGTIFVSVNTRLIPDADPIEQTRDLAAAMAFVQRNAAGWGGDASHLVLMGHSAGAHVASLLAVRPDLRQGVRGWSGTVLLDTAVLDLESLMEGRPPRLYRRAFGDDPAFWAAANPITHISRGDGPFLVVCSSLRRASCPAASKFAATGSRTGNAVSVLPVPLSHGEVNGELGKPSGYTEAVDAWMMGVLK